ncbi:MAG: polysaccharide deacetylase family protein [Opitutaceae bacterium]|jgi:peptidoglycan/xylan/chitin deacetylase (PgdA/CDA1 family)
MIRLKFTLVVALKLVALVLLFCDALTLPWITALFFLGDPWLLWNLLIPGTSGIVPVFTCFKTERPEVWLTIDDGPDPDDTPRLLDALERHGARATFFLVGERAARHPELVTEITRRGHEIGHHTQTHPERTFWCATPARLARELDDALAVFARSGVRPTRFRAPVGIKSPFLGPLLAARGLACIAWSVRSHDSFASDAGSVLNHVLPRVRSGSVILMHEGPRLNPSVRVTAIDRLLAALTERGLRCIIPTAAQLR